MRRRGPPEDGLSPRESGEGYPGADRLNQEPEDLCTFGGRCASGVLGCAAGVLGWARLGSGVLGCAAGVLDCARLCSAGLGVTPGGGAVLQPAAVWLPCAPA